MLVNTAFMLKPLEATAKEEKLQGEETLDIRHTDKADTRPNQPKGEPSEHFEIVCLICHQSEMR